jgi:hypothetical protein
MGFVEKITLLLVFPAASKQANQKEGWRWRGGSSSGGSAGVYGLCGEDTPRNNPPNTAGALSWWDEEHQQLWMYGGYTQQEEKKVKLDTLWSFDARRCASVFIYVVLLSF